MAAPKKTNLWLPTLFGLIVIILLVIIFFNMRNRHSWSLSFSPEDKEPYGTSMIFELMKSIRSNQEFITIKDSVNTELPVDPTDKKDTYIFIGNDFYGDQQDVESILEFVERGNNAFFCCMNQSNLVFDSLVRAPYDPYAGEYYYDEEGVYPIEDYSAEPSHSMSYYSNRVYETIEDTLYLKHDLNANEETDCEISYVRDFETIKYSWVYYKDSLLTHHGENTQMLAHFNEGYNNYFRLKYGEGEIYFHSTPIVFTNYFMRNDSVMKYSRQALSYFGNGKIYWDEDNRTYDTRGISQTSDIKPSKPGEGPLEFILSEKVLKIAWYTLLAATLLYVFFGAKRKQRIIATTENMENTSIEYAQVISQMFMNQQDHKKLVVMKMDLLRSFIRDRYGIRLPLNMVEEDEALYAQIAQKSSIQIELIRSIFEKHKILSSIVIVETKEMLEFHQLTEKFYSLSK
ncbi:MAG: DUF4350 domain-containing protein [Flavobacteriales bacterium]|nr:DUF4350 domain-containing protein [Flavobacteriales bacterium]